MTFNFLLKYEILVPKMEKIFVLLCIIREEVKQMGNIIKINMYVEMKKKNHSKIKLETLEQNILKYNKWLKMTDREDMIENYEKFLQAQ
jgi:hypothetical protein